MTDFMVADVYCGAKNDCEQDELSGSFMLPDFRYEEIKDIVADVMETHNVNCIPVDVFLLAKKLGMRLVKFSDLDEYEMKQLAQWGITDDTDGFYALAVKSGVLVPYIYYNDGKKRERIRFTILHEIAHHVLEHHQQSVLAEAEANFFAKYLIAPPVLVEKIYLCGCTDIATQFDVSAECAWNAFDYYQKWKRHYIRVGRKYETYETRILAVCKRYNLYSEENLIAFCGGETK